tara:strand:- start:17587 stop:19374 length:1788 start_codon:yes stop_codon:yes gene_type:complete
MPIRTKKKWKRDSRGHFPRELGQKRTDSGKLVPHKFRLKCNEEAEAVRRNARLEELWLAIESEAEKFDWEPLWNELTIMIGQQIAEGRYTIEVSKFEKDSPDAYARYINRLQTSFPMVTFVPARGLTEVFEEGAEDARRKASRSLKKRMAEFRAEFEDKLVRFGGLTRDDAMNGSEMLHEALDEYVEYIKTTDIQPGTDILTDYGQMKINNVERLKERHNNIPLKSLSTFDSVQALLNIWRNRPLVKNSDPPRPVTIKTARHHIAELMRFLRWLNRTSHFDWRKPRDFDELDTRVKETPQEKKRRNGHTQVATYTIEELKLLNEYATPLERLLLLLGLNCGFGAAEQGRVTLSDIFLNQHHPNIELLQQHELMHEFECRPTDSFLMTSRPKTGVWGEWLLWPQTVEAIKWGRQRRERIGGANQDALLLVTSRGTPFLKSTSAGNRSQNFSRRWADLNGRVKKEHNSFPTLSFGKLRKTAGTMIRHMAGGEIAGIFLCHGTPDRGNDLLDVYTDRPFPKLFTALRDLQEKLAPVFDAAPNDLFAQPTQQYTGLSKIKRIYKLKDDGMPVRDIAMEVGISKSAVHRHLKARAEKAKV